MNRRRRTGQMIDLIDFKQNRFNNIMSNELKPRIAKTVNKVFFPPGKEIINNNNLITPLKKLIHQMTADKSSSTSNNNPLPTTSDSNRNSPGLSTESSGETMSVRSSQNSGGEATSVMRCDAGESRLQYEESGADQDTDENEEKTLLSEDVVDGSGERSGVLECFGMVR